MPSKTWIGGEGGIELIDHHWNARTRCLEGTTVSIPVGEVFERFDPRDNQYKVFTVARKTG